MRLSFAYSNRAQHQSTLAEITARQLSALNSEGGEFCLGLDGRPIFLNNNMSETIIVLYGGEVYWWENSGCWMVGQDSGGGETA